MSPARGRAGRGLVGSAAVLGGWTLLSRLLGYVRDSLNAALFGAGWVADAFFVAYRIPNMLRDLVGEGALSAAVVPAAARRAHKPDGRRLLSALLARVLLAGVLLTGLGWLAAPALVGWLAPGFRAQPGAFDLTVALTRWLLPFIVCVSLAAVFQGWLTAHERFGPQAFAPVALNLSIIAAAVLIVPRCGDDPRTRVFGWTAGVLLGGVAQFLVQLPAVRALGWRWRFGWRHRGVREVGILMVPALAGFSVTQIHLLVNTILASLLPEGTVTRLYYGNRLMQLPLGVVGVALATAAYPAVAKALAAGTPARAAKPLTEALGLTAFAILPASAGLIALAEPITGLLFRFGKFTSADAAQTALLSSAYAAGILFHAWMRVLTPPFYAAGRPYQPVLVAASGVAANALLSAVLMLRIGAVGLPLSTTLVTAAGSGWLLLRARVLMPGTADGLARPLASMAVAAAVMGWAVHAGVGAAAPHLAALGWSLKAREAALTGGGLIVGAVIYLSASSLLRVPQWRTVRSALRRRNG